MQRYFVKEKRGNGLVLESGDVHHVKNVMRMQEGTLIECVYEEKLYICRVVDPGQELVEIVEEKTDSLFKTGSLVVAIGLVKEQKMDLILQKLTELGVDRIIPLKMERSIVQLDEKRFQKKKERWTKICKEAAEQSKGLKVPEIADVCTLKQLGQMNFERKFVCSTRNGGNLVNKYLQGQEDYATMVFVIGPEGGISPLEEELLESLGYVPVSLGSRVLRVETAAIYIASIVNFCSMR